MKYLPLLAIALLSGCQTPNARLASSILDPSYTKLAVTDFEGDPMAEWIAEGSITKVEQGYSIKAVQRTSGGAYPTVSKYPNGWRTTVTGPNIIKQRVDKPDWLATLDGDPAPAR